MTGVCTGKQSRHRQEEGTVCGKAKSAKCVGVLFM